MAVPLTSDGQDLASKAVGLTPRFAAMLMSASQQKEPVSVESHLAKQDAATLSMHIGDVVRWGSSAALQATAVSAGVPSTGEPDTGLIQGARSMLQGLASIYNRIIGERPVSAARSSEQIQDDLRPSAPGTTSSSMKKEVENTPARQQYENTMLTAQIVGVGFGNSVNRAADNGAFDAYVARQVQSAADVIAPGKLLSSLSPVELGAVATSAIQASQGAFLKQMRIQNPEIFKGGSDLSRKVVEVSKTIPSADQVAKTFMKDGKFSEELFNKKTTEGEGITAAQAAANGKQAEQVLLNTSMQRAVNVVSSTNFSVAEKDVSSQTQMERWSIKNALTVHSSLQGREDRLTMTDRPAEVDDERQATSARPKAF